MASIPPSGFLPRQLTTINTVDRVQGIVSLDNNPLLSDISDFEGSMLIYTSQNLQTYTLIGYYHMYDSSTKTLSFSIARDHLHKFNDLGNKYFVNIGDKYFEIGDQSQIKRNILL